MMNRKTSKIRLEIDEDTFLRLINRGELLAPEFRCLDCDSKHCVRKLFLMSCSNTLKPLADSSAGCHNCGTFNHERSAQEIISFCGTQINNPQDKQMGQTVSGFAGLEITETSAI